jgi:predicted neuraminidase
LKFIPPMRVWFCLLILSANVCASKAQSGPTPEGILFPPAGSAEAWPGTPRDNHASTLVELQNGEILMAWFGGSMEGETDTAIYGSRLQAGLWSKPVVIARASGTAVWNPVLFHTKDGRLWLYYKVGASPGTWSGVRRFSSDEGANWSEPEALPAGFLGPVKDKPLILDDGSIVMGSSREADPQQSGAWTVWIERLSADDHTWSKRGPIVLTPDADRPDDGAKAAVREQQQPIPDSEAGYRTKIYPPAKETIGIIQPALIDLGSGHLRFYARSKSRAARIAVADSLDGGQSWTQARLIELPNPNSGIDAVRLKDGRIVMIFNNSYNRRTPLNLAVSADGEHFEVLKTLEDGEGQYSYPAIVQARNGDLLISYSWRRQSIRFRRVRLSEIPGNSITQVNTGK